MSDEKPWLKEARAATQFKPGNPGRPKGTRVRLTEKFLHAFYEDFDQYGADAIATVRMNDPSTYLRVAASLMPKEITGEDGGPLVVKVVRFAGGPTTE